MHNDAVAERRRKRLVGGFIISIMVLSAFGFVLSQSGTQSRKYGDFKFKPYRNQWMTTIEDKKAVFNFHPSDLESINVTGDVKGKLSGEVVIITFDPGGNFTENVAEAAYFMGQSLQELDGSFIVWGLTNASGTQLPELSCANASVAEPIVYIVEAESSGVRVEGDCVIVSASRAQEFYAVAERLLYVIYGVMT